MNVKIYSCSKCVGENFLSEGKLILLGLCTP